MAGDEVYEDPADAHEAVVTGRDRYREIPVTSALLRSDRPALDAEFDRRHAEYHAASGLRKARLLASTVVWIWRRYT